jgi:hypothetical protein
VTSVSKSETLPKNKLKGERAEDMIQVVECLPSKCEALNSILSTERRKKKICP